MDDKNIIHFAHGNGFPSSCYQKLFSYLRDDYQIGYLDMSGHDANYPVTDNWDTLVDEQIHLIEKQYDKPVVGVGHSLGGILLFRASISRPDLFNSVVMLDSPIIGFVRSKFIQWIKTLGLIDSMTHAKRSKVRRQCWSNKKEAIEYFRHKELFKNFDTDCLNDYVTYALENTTEGLCLRFDRDIETEIYRTLPHTLPKYYHQQKVPLSLIYGLASTMVKQKHFKIMQKYFDISFYGTEGSHMFPFEHPEQCAKLIKYAIKLHG